MLDWSELLVKPYGRDLHGRNLTLLDALVKHGSPVVPPVKPRTVLKDSTFGEVDDHEVDYEFGSPNRFFGSHVNLIPMVSAVQGQRPFYGARFYNQAMPVVNPEAPLVQNLDDETQESFDVQLGKHAGALRASHEGEVTEVTPDEIVAKTPDGEKRISLYNHFAFNRKSQIHQDPLVKPGDKFQPGQLLARSNYTDKDGTLAMGLNARIGLVPYLGHSMDDAVVISDAFAKRLKSQHMYGHDLDYKRGVKGGKAHFTGVFPNKYVNDQLDKLDDDGVVKPGTILQPGDPFILATRPRVISSQASQLGQLSKHMRNARSPAEMVWEEDEPGVVTDVSKLRNGVKVNILVEQPTKVGDKVVLRSGQKNIVSHIIPDEHMPRTVDGKPLEMLLNPMGLPSRVNNNLVFELALGKIAKLTGKPYKLSGFNKPGEKWHQFVREELNKNQLTDKEEVFDPRLNRKLENPIMVGDGFVLKLHHTGSSKASARSQGSYDANMQPSHGSGPMAGSKRLSGLESYALLSSGAYNVMRDGATVRGTRNDDYWRKMRAGHSPEEPGAPFVWDKFKALLNGSGYLAKHLPDGALRLQMWRDQDLEEHKPIEVKNGDSVDIATLEPIKDGLFDPALTGANRWGYIQLPHKMPNPAAHDMIRKLLGLTEKEFRAVLAGQREL